MSGHGGGQIDLDSLIRDATARLAEAGVPSPEHDATALVARALEIPVGELRIAAARGDRGRDGFDPAMLDDLVARRMGREPLQHLTGVAPFRGIELEVGIGVFVPRPETEVVAGVAIDAAHAWIANGETTVEVADLCAGSGAIGLALAQEVPEAKVTLVEIDDEAVRWLRRNVAAAPSDVSARVEVVHANASRALAGRSGAYGVVVANPPYIPPDGAPIEPEAAFDPARALYGLGDDGLKVPRSVALSAARLLRSGGTLVMEHADAQGEALREALEGFKVWTKVRTGRDLTGRDRFIVAIRA
jgi:release factor glutamine methyltransferase